MWSINELRWSLWNLAGVQEHFEFDQKVMKFRYKWSFSYYHRDSCPWHRHFLLKNSYNIFLLTAVDPKSGSPHFFRKLVRNLDNLRIKFRILKRIFLNLLSSWYRSVSRSILPATCSNNSFCSFVIWRSGSCVTSAKILFDMIGQDVKKKHTNSLVYFITIG